MSKGLRLDQFKEPAFSSEILSLSARNLYISAVAEAVSTEAAVAETVSTEAVLAETVSTEAAVAETAIVNMSRKDNFVFLFNVGEKIKKHEIMAIKPVVDEKFEYLKMAAPENYVVGNIEYIMDENDKASSFAMLEYDGDELPASCVISDKEFQGKKINNKMRNDLIRLAYKADIIDETDGKYLFQKLRDMRNKDGIYKIYIDAIDDQPYTSSKESILLNYQNAINLAAQTIKEVFNVKVDILFYDIESYNREKKMPKKCKDTPIIGLRYNYPVRHHLSKKLDYDIFIGVQAMLHFARALIDENYKQTTTFLTVAGDCVLCPRNVEVPIGMSIKELVENFDLKKDPKRIVKGQALTGSAISDQETPVSATTRSVLVFGDHIVLKPMECIGCARCSSVCPQNLLPSYKHKFLETGNEIFEDFSFDTQCIKCYCCSYVCPSHIDLV